MVKRDSLKILSLVLTTGFLCALSVSAQAQQANNDEGMSASRSASEARQGPRHDESRRQQWMQNHPEMAERMRENRQEARRDDRQMERRAERQEARRDERQMERRNERQEARRDDRQMERRAERREDRQQARAENGQGASGYQNRMGNSDGRPGGMRQR